MFSYLIFRVLQHSINLNIVNITSQQFMQDASAMQWKARQPSSV